MKCEKVMRKRNGGIFCCKPAKFRVWYGDGPVVSYCGVHANQVKRRSGNVVPLQSTEVQS